MQRRGFDQVLSARLYPSQVKVKTEYDRKHKQIEIKRVCIR